MKKQCDCSDPDRACGFAAVMACGMTILVAIITVQSLIEGHREAQRVEAYNEMVAIRPVPGARF